jgi:holliday junction DNA helicase RuvA
MIAKLSGRVDGMTELSVIIDVGGVGYLVFCSSRTLSRLGDGQTVSLLIETQLREDGLHLYGFVDAEERHWFRLLIGVQGVGPKVALAMLGVASPSDIAMAIASDNRGVLTRAAGVGARLATRIVSELKDKTGAPPIAASAVALAGMPSGSSGTAADAVSALVNLGFRPLDAQSAVAIAAGRLGSDVALDALIRGSLAELTSKEQRA